MAEQEISKKRRATEARIIDAFDRLVRRDGLRSVGVNRVIEEAGVSKGLLYTYFGGLPGLVRAWGERKDIWPAIDELIDLHKGQQAPADLLTQMKDIVIRHAENLRQGTLRTELLADELMAPSAISEALSEVRRQLSQEHRAILAQNAAFRDGDTLAILCVLVSAATYISMRAVKSPSYMDADLSTEEGWGVFKHRMERVIELAMRSVLADQAAAESGTTSTDEPD